MPTHNPSTPQTPSPTKEQAAKDWQSHKKSFTSAQDALANNKVKPVPAPGSHQK